jgi:hypothetical protein
MASIADLKKFEEGTEINFSDEKIIKKALHSVLVKEILCYCLGPEGTNIGQAAQKWIKRMEIDNKAKIVFCQTVEESIQRARDVQQDGIIAIFWTCAVYVKEAEVFFTNPDIIPFFFIERMNLDNMQLSTTKDRKKIIEKAYGEIPRSWMIISHPSPAPLVRCLGCEIVFANSNAEAAKRCQEGECELCITTESAKERYGLETVFNFGNPQMVFFGGITSFGLQIIKKAIQ